MNDLTKYLLLATCLLLTACDSQDVAKGSQVIDATQKAYNAYEVRGLVIDEIMQANGLKKQLKTHWEQQGDFTGAKVNTPVRGQTFNPKSGVITIDLSGVSAAFQLGDVITLHPQTNSDYFDWECRSNVTSNLVPGSCQD